MNQKRGIQISNADKDPLVFVIRKVFAEHECVADFIEHMGSSLAKYTSFFDAFFFLPYAQYKQIALELSAIKSALQRADHNELRKAVYLYLLTVSPVFEAILVDILEPAGRTTLL